MITIRSAGSQPAIVLNQGYYAGSCANTTYTPYFQINMPNAGIVTPNYGCDLLDAYEYEVPFGYLAQGHRPRGKLLDKDVLHIKAEGEISFDWLAQSITPINGTRPSTANQWYVGDNYSTGTDTARIFGHLFRWGETSTVAKIFSQPTGGTGSHGPLTGGTIHWSYTCATHGDFMYVCSALVQQEFLTFLDGYRLSTGFFGAPYAYKGRIYRRYKDPGSNTWLYKYRDIPGTIRLGNTPRVKTPNNVLHLWNDVAFDLALWTSWCTTPVGGLTHDSLCHGTYDEFSNQRFEVEERIRLLLMERFSHTLVTFPSSKTTSDLTADIIAQHKVMDTMMLVTVFQLYTGNIDSVPWRNLTNIISTGQQAVKAGKTTVTALISAIKQISKDGSGTFLGTIYGVLPTWSDIGIAWNAADTAAKLRLKPPRLHARTTTNETPTIGSLSTQLVLTVDVDNIPKDFLSPPANAIRSIWSMGFWPTFEMAWDCVPFSFVLNWFIQFNDAIEDLDTHVWVKYFPIWLAISSEKRKWAVSLQDLWPDLDIPSSDVVITSYRRWCEDELPLPPIQLGDEPTGQFNHWAEAGALVIQKIF